MPRPSQTITLSIFVAGVAFLVQPVAVFGVTCSDSCTPSSSCENPCKLEPGPLTPETELITCGEYGVCNCIPDFRVIDETRIGVFEDSPPGLCRQFELVELTWRDVNFCGEPDFTTCDTRLFFQVADPSICCLAVPCFGPSSCPAP